MKQPLRPGDAINLLCRHIPYFEQHQGRGVSWNQIRNGIEVFTGFPCYDPEMVEFSREFRASGLAHHEFQAAIEKYGVDPDRCELRNAPLELVRALLERAVSGERFITGSWGSYLSSGRLLDLLRRLREIGDREDLNADLAAGATPIATTRIAGQYYVQNFDLLRSRLDDGDPLLLIPELNNPHDSAAILVCTTEYGKLGYIPRQINRRWFEELKAGVGLIARVAPDQTDREEMIIEICHAPALPSALRHPAELPPPEVMHQTSSWDSRCYEPVMSVRVAGSFAMPNRSTVLPALPAGLTVRLRREPGNRYDHNAVAIITADGDKIGYVPKKHNPVLAAELDNGVIFTGRIARINRVSAEIWVEIVRKLRLQLGNFTSFEFHSSAFFGPTVACSLNLRTGQLRHTRLPDPASPRQIFELSFSKKAREELPARLAACNFQTWSSDYQPHQQILDGECWTVIIRRGRSERQKVTGYHAYPEEWDIFIHLIADCLDMSQLQGDGRFLIADETQIKTKGSAPGSHRKPAKHLSPDRNCSDKRCSCGLIFGEAPLL